MGGTTPKMAFPYPTGTDKVADGDNAIQALAQRVEDVLDGSYQSGGFGFTGNVSNFDDNCYAWVVGKICICRLAIKVFQDFAAGWPLLTAPAGMRPLSVCRFQMSSYSPNVTYGAVIKSDGSGEMNIYNAITNGTSWYGTAVYIIA